MLKRKTTPKTNPLSPTDKNMGQNNFLNHETSLFLLFVVIIIFLLFKINLKDSGLGQID